MQLLRPCAAGLGGEDRRAQRQNGWVLGEYEDIVLEDDRSYPRVSADDALHHADTLLGLEPRHAGDAPLSFVQEVGRRAERAGHGTVVERDQPPRADLGETRLASRLRGQRTDSVRLLEALPIPAVRHPFIGRGEDRLPQLRARQRRLRYPQALAVRAAFHGSPHSPEGSPGAQSRGPLEQRTLALPAYDSVEGPASEHELGPDRRFHSTGDQQRTGRHTPGEVCKLQVESQRHPRRRNADDVPVTPENLALERALGRSGTAVGIEDSGLGSRALEHPGQAPDAQGGREKGVFPAMRVVRPDQQDPRRLTHGRPLRRPQVASSLLTSATLSCPPPPPTTFGTL